MGSLGRIIFLNLLLGFLGNLLFAQDDDWVIYGPDNREEIYQSQSFILRSASSAVGLRLKESDLTLKFPTNNDFLIPRVPTAGKKYNLCPEVRFSEQLALGSCSGFLVSPKILITAGHCMRSQNNCTDYKWGFNYRQDFSVAGTPFLLREDIYGCKKILFVQNPTQESELDLAVIELDREVQGAKVLELETNNKTARWGKNKYFGMVGHPLGMTQKSVDKAKAHPRGVSDLTFSLALDAFGNNSGSPVINLKSGEVAGVLIAGESDWEMDLKRQCKIEKRCEQRSCRGESVLKSEKIVEILDGLTDEGVL